MTDEETLWHHFLENIDALYDDIMRSRLGLLRTGRRSSEFVHGIHTQSYLWGRALECVALYPELAACELYLTDITKAAQAEAYARFMREVKEQDEDRDIAREAPRLRLPAAGGPVPDQ